MKKSILPTLAAIFLTTHAGATDQVTDQEVRAALRAIYPNEMTPEPCAENKPDPVVPMDAEPMQGVYYGEQGLEQAYLWNDTFLRIQGYRLSGRLGHLIETHPSIQYLYLSNCGDLTESDICTLAGFTNLKAFKLDKSALGGALLSALVDALPKDLTILDLRDICPSRVALDYLLYSPKFILSKLSLQLGKCDCAISTHDLIHMECSVLGLAKDIYLGPEYPDVETMDTSTILWAANHLVTDYNAFYSKEPASQEVYFIDQPLDHGFFWCKEKNDGRCVWALKDSRPSSSRTGPLSYSDSGTPSLMGSGEIAQLRAQQQQQFLANAEEIRKDGVPATMLRLKLGILAARQAAAAGSPTASPKLQFNLDDDTSTASYADGYTSDSDSSD